MVMLVLEMQQDEKSQRKREEATMNKLSWNI